MSHEKDIKRLIEKHTRRLQKLKEQQAVFGLHTPPYVLTEIEDAEVEIEQLRTELNEVVSTGKETVQTQRNFLWLWISSALLVIVISLLGMSSILTTLSNETPKIITTSQKVVPPTDLPPV